MIRAFIFVAVLVAGWPSTPALARSVTYFPHRQGRDLTIWSGPAGAPKCFVSRRGSRTSITCTR